MRYSKERKEAVLCKMMPPHNRSIVELAKEEGIAEATLYNWRREARNRGCASSEGWRVQQEKVLPG
jgi:transposase-like protein